MKKKFLIVGQGIAGTALSYELYRQGKSFVVYNDETAPSSSLVAAGIFNPITGKRLAKTWRAEELFGVLEPFYTDLEKLLGTSFFHRMPIYHPFVRKNQQDSFKRKIDEQDFSQFIEAISETQRFGNLINDPYGGVSIKKGGYVDLAALIQAYRKFLKSIKAYHSCRVDPNELIISPKEVSFRGVTARAIIFCDGAAARANSLFNWLPFNQVKGEFLTIQAKTNLQATITGPVFIQPRQNNIHIIGSTWDHKNLDNKPTQTGRAQIEEKLQSLANFEYQIIDHSAGVRPTTLGHRPFVGMHPEYTNVGIFGGLGSKGTSMAPYLAQQFVDFLCKNKPLDSQIDINRYNFDSTDSKQSS